MGGLFTQMPNLCIIYSLLSKAAVSSVFLLPQPTYPNSSFFLMGSTVTIIVNCHVLLGAILLFQGIPVTMPESSEFPRSLFFAMRYFSGCTSCSF